MVFQTGQEIGKIIWKFCSNNEPIKKNVIVGQDSTLTLEKFSPNASDLSFDFELMILKKKNKVKLEKLRALGGIRKIKTHITDLIE